MSLVKLMRLPAQATLSFMTIRRKVFKVSKTIRKTLDSTLSSSRLNSTCVTWMKKKSSKWSFKIINSLGYCLTTLSSTITTVKLGLTVSTVAQRDRMTRTKLTSVSNSSSTIKRQSRSEKRSNSICLHSLPVWWRTSAVNIVQSKQ
jgi:hypothetical protein